MSTTYRDLLELFRDWRQFQPPVLVDGVPDYGPSAMASQHRELAAYRRRLAAIDPARCRSRSRSTTTSSERR